MKVILLEGVKKLGNAGDTVEVKDGYAQNYLFVKKLAVPANKANLNDFNNRKSAREHLSAMKEAEARRISQEIKDQHFEFKAKAGQAGKLYGTITSQNIADLLTDKGYAVDKKDIVLQENIKQLGTFKATIKLHQSVSTDIYIDVTAE